MKTKQIKNESKKNSSISIGGSLKETFEAGKEGIACDDIVDGYFDEIKTELMPGSQNQKRTGKKCWIF